VTRTWFDKAHDARKRLDWAVYHIENIAAATRALGLPVAEDLYRIAANITETEKELQVAIAGDR